MSTTDVRMQFRLDFPPELWRENLACEKPHSRLKLAADVTINGMAVHVEAVEVSQREETIGGEFSSTQYAVGVESIDDLDLMGELTGADGPFTTIRLFDRDYVVVITPYCD